MTTIYRKTAKGQREIETREHRLSPRLRTALILVDGKRDGEELGKLFGPEAAATLQSLLAEDYVEVFATRADRTVATAQPDAPAAVAAPSARGFEQRRRDAVRHINDQVGPMAEAIAMRMEKCSDWGQLLPALQMAQQILRNTRGADAATDFGRLFIDTPPV